MNTPSLNKKFKIGCIDSSCLWGSPGGMSTNGGCRCYGKTVTYDRVSLEARMQRQSGILLLRQLAALPEVMTALEALVEKVITKATQCPWPNCGPKDQCPGHNP